MSDLPLHTHHNNPPLSKYQEPFICGTLHWSYWSRVSALGTNPLRFAMATHYWAGFRTPRGGIRGVRIGLASMWALGLNPYTARRALRTLEQFDLILVEYGPGRKPIVRLADWREYGRDRSRSVHRPLPWRWWYRASPLPGKALIVALALWFQAAWSGSRDTPFTFNLSDWEFLKLTRFAASRGLRALEKAGLVKVEWRLGQSPIVMILTREVR